MLAKRILTGIVGGAFTIFVIYEGNWLFFLMMALLSLVAWYEYGNLVRKLHAVPADKCSAGSCCGRCSFTIRSSP